MPKPLSKSLSEEYKAGLAGKMPPIDGFLAECKDKAVLLGNQHGSAGRTIAKLVAMVEAYRDKLYSSTRLTMFPELNRILEGDDE